MWDSMRDRKVGLYPAIVVTSVTTLLFGVGSFWLGRWNGEAAITTMGTEVPVIPIGQSNTADAETPPGISPSAAEDTVTTPVKQSQETIATSRILIPKQGGLRIANQSSHPIRVALRSRIVQPKGSKADDKTSNSPSYEPSAHWDFAPGEGGDRGLLLALPNRAVQLKKGDVLVAFAQDGSQRYWGPFIVGETDDPVWNPQTGEWKLQLEE